MAVRVVQQLQIVQIHKAERQLAGSVPVPQQLFQLIQEKCPGCEACEFIPQPLAGHLKNILIINALRSDCIAVQLLLHLMYRGQKIFHNRHLTENMLFNEQIQNQRNEYLKQRSQQKRWQLCRKQRQEIDGHKNIPVRILDRPEHGISGIPRLQTSERAGIPRQQKRLQLVRRESDQFILMKNLRVGRAKRQVSSGRHDLALGTDQDGLRPIGRRGLL